MAAVGAVVFVALVALVSTLVVTSNHDSNVAERGNTPEHQPASYPRSTPEYPTSSSSSAATTTSSESSTSSTSSTYDESSTRTSVTGPSRETSSGPAPVHELADNPLFANEDYGLPNIACDLPRWETSPTAAERFFRGARDCLDDSWQQLLDAVELPARSPR